MDSFEDVDRNMDEGAKKTGEKKKHIFILAGSAALGAILGDIFIGREYSITNIEFHQNPVDSASSITYHEHIYGTDRGGIIEDVTEARQLDDTYTHVITTKVISGGHHYDNVVETRQLDEYELAELKDFGYFAGAVTESVTPIGGIVGGFAGLGGGFAANWAKNRKNRKKEADY